nr:PREDICTED: activating signal cointegrator 1 complex subunit 2 [Latimeria chalumnae]|eukprot:XP_006014323.1 PREDICTED: activating signal cointegrator 1 complex subunit 2 [Latimeria chalumnae]
MFLCSSSVQVDLWRRISHSRKKMVEFSHTIINYVCLQPILENSSENIQSFIEDFLRIFTALLHEKRFLADYDEQFSIADDISLLQQASSNLDETRTSYILQAVDCAQKAVGKQKPVPATDHIIQTPPEATSASVRPVDTNQGTSLSWNQYEYEAPYRECAGAAAPRITGVELDSLVSQVKDLLPDLGESFILACLEEYNYSTEQVINNILEDKLAPSLQKLDWTLVREVKVEKPTLLSTRSNIYENDEFDVFTRDSVDVSRVWKGRRRGEDSKHLLNDKCHIVEQRARYSQYSVVVDEVPVDENGIAFYGGDYDDEYDDTYDANQVGANDIDSDDLINRRPFTTPRVLRGTEREMEQEDNDDEEEAEEENQKVVELKDPILLLLEFCATAQCRICADLTFPTEFYFFTQNL